MIEYPIFSMGQFSSGLGATETKFGTRVA